MIRLETKDQIVYLVEPVSCLIVPKVAKHGAYKRINTKRA